MTGRLRALGIGAVSILVVLTAVVYVVAPGRPVLELSVTELTGRPSYEGTITAEYSLAAAIVAARARYTETIYGKISNPAGIPVTRARLVIRGAGPRVRGMKATIRVGRVGRAKTFRSIVRLRPGKYDLNLLLLADGRMRKKTATRWLRNGRSYQVSAEVRESGIVTMLPISTY